MITDLINNPETILEPVFIIEGYPSLPIRVVYPAPQVKPEPSWISKRLFVKRVLPDATMVRGIFGKLAVVSNTFSDQVGGGSLTGWQENDNVKSIWERAYRNLTTGSFDNFLLRNRINRAKRAMALREEGRGRTEPRKTTADYPNFPRGVITPLRNADPEGRIGSPMSGYERRFYKDLRATQAVGRGTRTVTYSGVKLYGPDDEPKETIEHVFDWGDPDLEEKMLVNNVPRATITQVMRMEGIPYQFFTKPDVFGTSHHFLFR